jgi:ATP-dependent 26S proteasome regulatory subunit
MAFQPALVVIEDVDLIARDRRAMHGPCEDAEIFFVLTTNRPEELEPALASRPGRLYARDLLVSEPSCETIVRRTEGGSAALIKELMRRSAQFALEDQRESRLEPADIESALEEMFLSGGTLNARLLGFHGEERNQTPAIA